MCEVAFVVSPWGHNRSTSNVRGLRGSLVSTGVPGGRRGANLILRRADVAEVITEVITPQQAQATIAAIPRLPEWADKFVGGFLTVFPFVVLASWGFMNWTYWEQSKEAKEKDERRKISKALKTDPDFDDDDDDSIVRAPEPGKKRRRRAKKTALKEVMAMDRAERRAAAKSEKSSAY